MKNKVKKISTVNKVIIGSLLLIALTNPFSVGYMGYATEVALKYFTLYSSYGFIAGLVILAGVNVYMVAKPQKINIPKVKSTREV
jgi:hypothetical protein